ncbi:MAG: hypothetical protein LBV30_04150 [Propionibacteriaceae bacterium]|jgi:hypothetical protein|nr:hypothetical protein [Propionibacteriaceae bacterium]
MTNPTKITRRLIASGLAVFCMAAALTPTAQADDTQPLTVTPTGWVATGSQFTVSGADCAAKNNGSDEVVITASYGSGSDSWVVKPAADGSWSTDRIAAYWGNGQISATCVMYDESTPSTQAAKLTEPAAAGIAAAAASTRRTFDYVAQPYAFTGFAAKGEVTAGATVTISGGGYAPGETVSFTIGNGFFASLVADAQGNIKGQITIPADATVAGAAVTAQGQSSRRAVSDAVVAVAAPVYKAEVGTPTYVMPALGTDVI